MPFAVLLLLAAWLCAGPSAAQPANPSAATEITRWSLALQEAMKVAVGAPGRVSLLDRAMLRLSGDLVYIPHDRAVKLMQLRDEPDGPDVVGVLLDGGDPEWFAILRFIGKGFVDADDYTDWSADDLLDSLQAANAARNLERVKHGEVERDVAGWLQPPQYDSARHTLIWAAQVVRKGDSRDSGGEAVFHGVVFGRGGYFRLDVSTVVDHLDRQKRAALAVLDNLRFVPGRLYSDFKSNSDPVSPAGLHGVFGITTLIERPWYAALLPDGVLVPVLAGGALILGAAVLLVARVMMFRRRYQRR